ncbi:MAG: hypothetical protein HZA53_04795 [Planctomycetes bacterium]|nr:hypothetical protein [Planctomycetota bacterium]
MAERLRPTRARANALFRITVALSCSATLASARQGVQVATFRLAAPAAGEFVLRATLPVPPGTFLPENGGSAFHVRNPDGAMVPAQTEVVSRYPQSTDGADVVEVLARVRRPAGAQPGDALTYPVLLEPHRLEQTAPGAQVALLLATTRAVYARATDAFGHEYVADLYEDVRIPGGDRYRVLRAGLAARTEATHQSLRAVDPETGPLGTLPHLMGVHAYFTQWSGEDFLSLDLRVHNAASGQDPATPLDDALQKLYFGTFELRLPHDWVVLDAFPNPYFGAPLTEGSFRVWPIVAPLANGKLHVLPQMAQFQRRLVIAHDDPETIARALVVLREENLGYCAPGAPSKTRPLWSWWNAGTARYFPQRRRMPDLGMLDTAQQIASDQGALAVRQTQLATGSTGPWPAQSAGLGWAHPWGVTDGGMVSGDEIWLYDGLTTAWCASNSGYRFAELRHRMYVDRQRNVLFNAPGNPTAVHQWVVHDAVHGDYLPVWWFNGPMLWAADPFGLSTAPTFQNDWVAANGKAPAYDAELGAYQSIDEAHLGRFTHDAKVLVWLGNDALAKDDLRGQAESFHFGYSELPQDIWNGTIVSGLRASETYVAGHPGNGFSFGRREGWCLDAVCAAYSTSDELWRARNRPWLARVVNVIEAGQSTCTGTIQATLLYNVFNAQYRCRQSIEAAIGEHALVALRESVFGRGDPAASQSLNRVLANSTRAMIAPLYWSSAGHAPWSLIAVGPGDSAQPLYCNSIPADGNGGNVDAYQCWSSFAYGYELGGDAQFLLKAQEMLGQNLRSGLEDHVLENLNNRAAILELVQRLQ